MRIMVAGEWRWFWYQEAFANALKSWGCTVDKFEWGSRFYLKPQSDTEPESKNLYLKIQKRFHWGPTIRKINEDLFQFCLNKAPDVLFNYNTRTIWPATLKKIKQTLPNISLVQYSNDNPFSENADYFLWRHFKNSLPHHDLHFVYRHSNLDDIRKIGGESVHLMRSYFIPEVDYRVELNKNDEQYRSDVLFAGHYEADSRVEYLESVADLDINFRLHGGSWDHAAGKIAPNSPLVPYLPALPALGEEYRKVISGTKIALCFLSSLNKDTYTRRCFQIPAMGTFLLSEYTDDLASLYREGKEIEFFRSKDEMLDKISYYLEHEDARKKIACAGLSRVTQDGHDIRSRARAFLDVIEEFRGERT